MRSDTIRWLDAPAELEKTAALRGRYLHPELYRLSQQYAEHLSDLAPRDDLEPKDLMR